MADRNKEALLEVRRTVNQLMYKWPQTLSAFNCITYLGHVRNVTLVRITDKEVCVRAGVFLWKLCQRA